MGGLGGGSVNRSTVFIKSVSEAASRFSNVLLTAFGAMNHIYEVPSVTIKMGTNSTTQASLRESVGCGAVGNVVACITVFTAFKGTWWWGRGSKKNLCWEGSQWHFIWAGLLLWRVMPAVRKRDRKSSVGRCVHSQTRG